MKSVVEKNGAPRSDASPRLPRVRAFQRTSRLLSRLFLTEQEPRRLIEQACAILVDSALYHDAWLTLFDGEPSRQLKHPLEPGPIVAVAARDIEQPSPQDRRTEPEFLGSTSFTHRLHWGGVTWGNLTALLPDASADDPEEEERFSEFAEDLAFALHRITVGRASLNHPPSLDATAQATELTKGEQSQNRRSASAIHEEGIPSLGFGTRKDITNDMILPRPIDGAETVGTSDVRLESVFNSLDGVPIQIYDQQRRVVFWNPASEKLYGFTSEEAVGRKLEDLVVPSESKQETVDLVCQWFDTGEAIPATELELQRKDGKRLRVYSNHVLFTKSQGQRELFSIDVDLTKMRRVEQHMLSLSAVVDNSDNIVVIKDLNLRVIAANQAFAKVAGHETVDSLIGKTDAEIFGVTPETEPIRSYMADERHAQTLQTGESILREEPLVTADGRKLTYLTRKYPIFDSSKTLIATGNISTDITERKTAEQRFRETEERFATAFERSPAPLVLSEIESGRFIDVNDRWVKMLGFTREEQIGETSKGVGIWQDPEARDRLVKVLRTQGRFRDEAVRFRKKSGETIFGLWSAETVQLGGQQRMLSMITDVTQLRAVERERERTQQELLQQTRSLELRNRIAHVFLTSPSDRIYSDVLDVLLSFFESSFGYFGYINDAGDLVCPSMTRDIWEATRVSDKSVVFPRTRWGGLWGRSLEEERTVVSDGDLRVPEGHVPLRQAIATPIMHRGRCIGQFVLANREGGFDEGCRLQLEAAAAVTAPILHAMLETARQKLSQRALEEQLRQAQKMEAVGRLAGGVAHDFNNMLTVISMNAKLLLSDLPAESPMREELEEIHEAAMRSVDLTRQLLAFAREQPVAPKVVDLNAAVQSMLKMLERLIGEHVTIVWKPADLLCPLELDPSQIDQILANLCLNARDAISDVGEIRISTENVVFDVHTRMHSAGVRPGHYVRLSVSDNGCGIEPQALPLLFEPFFTTKEVGKGTGLGLATVYGAVHQNGGFIEVDSEVGSGSTFRIYLPRREPTTRIPPKEERRIAGQVCRAMVLVVDDEAAIVRLTRKVLETHGYQVMTASSPGEALRLARRRECEIHLLITDVVMPEMNGRTLSEKLTALQPSVKCIFMSGYTGDAISERGVHDQQVHLLGKPFSDTDLLRMVERVLRA